ncbi:glycosyltransferase, partial [Candidatus Saccharibacteria bacterium]|nr:glycosyltransferase family 4 protein [Candidatus Saccharibacteria bacterium]NIV72235.1 glycosyltransferase [Calditrichia bacterium]NIV99191.1 glycosyltransferase [Candidatus Saccharibacteria bacterium]NIW80175.1 glycosyltransferase [Calditrichia bacterium]
LVAAAKLSQIPFLIIGVEKDLFDRMGLKVPQNVRLLPEMDQQGLRGYYQKCAVFCQPSRSEGMPNTLCEAMACGCIPVGMDVDGIPTAIGDTGFVVPLGDVNALAEALQKAVRMDISQGFQARERIINEFPLQRRISGLRRALEEI